MFFPQKKGSLILVLDVQSSIVRGTLVHIPQTTGKPLILFTRDAPIPYKQNARSGYLVKTALHAINQTIQDALVHLHARRDQHYDVPARIDAVHYVLSSPWIVSQAKTLSLNFDTHTVIDRARIQKIIADDRQGLISNTIEDVRVIEEKVFDVRLNGYSIPSWEGRTTDKLEVSFVTSVAGGRMIEHFIDACDAAVRKSHVFFHSSLFLQHIGICKIFPEHSSYLLIHAHGELTDVAIVHANACVFSGSYPFGIHSIVRTVAREMKTDIYTAESMLNMFSEDKLDPTHAAKEATIIKNMGDGWIGEFRKLLKSSSIPHAVPRHIIISAHSHEDFFMKNFSRAYPSNSLELLTIEQVTPSVTYDVHVDKERLTGLYVIAIHSMEK